MSRSCQVQIISKLKNKEDGFFDTEPFKPLTTTFGELLGIKLDKGLKQPQIERKNDDPVTDDFERVKAGPFRVVRRKV